MLDLISVVILSLVEGITEFLPVSSTGHLIVVGHFLGLEGEKAATFEIFIQAGAILSVIVLYFNRFMAVFDFKNTSNEFAGRSLILKFACACGPFLVLGAFFGKAVKNSLFNPTSVAVAFIAGGLIMLWVESRNREVKADSLEKISNRDALLIGIAQCAALWPGISRSGATIVAALLLGMSRKTAAEFSFLIAVPILLAATGYDLLKSLPILSYSDVLPFGLGFALSFLSAIVAIKAFIKLLGEFTLKPFAYYRLLFGTMILVFMSQAAFG